MCVRFFPFFYFLFLLSRCFFSHHPCRIWLPYFATIVFDGCQLYGCSLKTTARFHLLCTALASCHKVKTDILLLFMACVCVFFSLSLFHFVVAFSAVQSGGKRLAATFFHRETTIRVARILPLLLPQILCC